MTTTDNLASAVSRDGFTFNGHFCVDVDGHLHKREDPATLYVLLNAVPPITKDGKIARNSDREAHFYTAQLLHYGLPPLKTRDPAKKRLLTAFGGVNGRTLTVPPHILALEAEMSKEYRDLEAKLAKKETAALNKKRKAEAAGMNTSNTTEAAKKGKTSTQASTQAAAQMKTVAATKASAPAKAPPTPKASTTTKPPAALKVTTVDTQASSSKPPGPSKSASKIRSKAQMQRDITVLPEDVARKLLSKLLDKVPEVKDTMAEELTKWEINTLKASVAAASPLEEGTAFAPAAKSKAVKAPKAGRVPKAEKVEEMIGSLASLDSRAWCGPYTVRAPALAEQWDEASGSLTLDLYPSSTGAHIWGHFDFGIISGVIRSRSAAPSAFNVPIPFEWRGREQGENVMTFDDCNKGTITFTSQGKITGTMGAEFCADFTFSGQYRQVPKKSDLETRRAVTAWKSKWRNINEWNYEVENNSRWGRWGGEEREDKPFESDTTVGYDASEDEEDDYGYGRDYAL